MRSVIFILSLACFLNSCEEHKTREEQAAENLVQETVKPAADTLQIAQPEPESLGPAATIDTKDTSPIEILDFARTLTGTPYLFASTDPAKGFDCSGFITYVFNHFNIRVPRSSVEFTNVGKEVTLGKAEPGDLVLFTGTDSSIRVVGHMGIIEARRNDSLFFIHSSSGKANGVVTTPMNKYYQGRFVKVIRVFPDRYFVNID